MLLPLLSFSFIYKLDFLSLLSIFSRNKIFLCLFVKKSSLQLSWHSMSKVHLKVSMIYLGCWTFYTVRASCRLFKKKGHWRLLTTKHSLTVMNYFTPLEGFSWLILYETYFLLLYSQSRCFLSHRIHWWLNSLHSSSFLNTHPPQEMPALFVRSWKQYTSTAG